MNVRTAVTATILLLTLPGTRAVAQADEHARAVARATCQSGKQSQAVTQAAAALERAPDELGLRMRLADALVDQGCYQEAVGVLEAGEEAHPRSRELAGKLRDVRSLVTEQTYIEGLTQAAEAAKFQRNQLRCSRLADLAACEDALKIKPEDPQLLAAKEEATKAKLAADQVGAAQAATATQAAEATRSQHASPNLQASAAGHRARSTESATRVAAAEGTTGPKQPKRAPGAPAAPEMETPGATIASLAPLPRMYSNEAPPGQTN